MSDLSLEQAAAARVAALKVKRAASPRAAPTRVATPRTEEDVVAQEEFSADYYNQGDDAPVSRMSRDQVINNRFWIPPQRKKRGWDYEWKVTTVYNQPSDPSERAVVYQQGWRPCKAKDFPELCPPGWEKDTVEQYGQMLYSRPMHLTQEARDEDTAAAEKQKRDRIEGAMNGKPTGGGGLADIKGVIARPLQVEIEGEVGSYAR